MPVPSLHRDQRGHRQQMGAEELLLVLGSARQLELQGPFVQYLADAYSEGSKEGGVPAAMAPCHCAAVAQDT